MFQFQQQAPRQIYYTSACGQVPQFEHDGYDCHAFFGRVYDPSTGGEMDMWVLQDTTEEDAMLCLRYGDAPSEYMSFPYGIVQQMPEGSVWANARAELPAGAWVAGEVHTQEAEANPAFKIQARFCTNHQDEEGQASYERVIVATIRRNWDSRDMSDFLEEHMPAEHCQHSYDCCGKFYASRGRVYQVDTELGTITFRQDVRQNV